MSNTRPPNAERNRRDARENAAAITPRSRLRVGPETGLTVIIAVANYAVSDPATRLSGWFLSAAMTMATAHIISIETTHTLPLARCSCRPCLENIAVMPESRLTEAAVP
jgi:hypothetical protein